jgi:hypothetical protein
LNLPILQEYFVDAQTLSDSKLLPPKKYYDIMPNPPVFINIHPIYRDWIVLEVVDNH